MTKLKKKNYKKKMQLQVISSAIAFPTCDGKFDIYVD